MRYKTWIYPKYSYEHEKLITQSYLLWRKSEHLSNFNKFRSDLINYKENNYKKNEINRIVFSAPKLHPIKKIWEHAFAKVSLGPIRTRCLNYANDLLQGFNDRASVMSRHFPRCLYRTFVSFIILTNNTFRSKHSNRRS